MNDIYAQNNASTMFTSNLWYSNCKLRTLEYSLSIHYKLLTLNLYQSVKRPYTSIYLLYIFVYILDVGPITVTTDPKKFQRQLQRLYVQGGGDCPEMSITAIRFVLKFYKNLSRINKKKYKTNYYNLKSIKNRTTF